MADPDSADKLWLGHPHRRWSSFLKTSTVEGLSASRAAVFAAHGVLDRSVPVGSFDVLRAELTGRGRDLTALRLEGRDHGFRKTDEAPGNVSGFEEVFGRVVAWFQEKRSPSELAVQRDLERMQGNWQMAAMNVEGEVQPRTGAMGNLQLHIEGEQRTDQVRRGCRLQGLLPTRPGSRAADDRSRGDARRLARTNDAGDLRAGGRPAARLLCLPWPRPSAGLLPEAGQRPYAPGAETGDTVILGPDTRKFARRIYLIRRYVGANSGGAYASRKPHDEHRKVPTGTHLSAGTSVSCQKDFCGAPSTQVLTRRLPPP